MRDAIVQALVVVTLVAQPVFLFYFLLYNTYTLVLVGLSARQVRRRVASGERRKVKSVRRTFAEAQDAPKKTAALISAGAVYRVGRTRFRCECK